MGLYGPASVFAHVDGYDLTALKIKSFSRKVTAKQERTDGLGDVWEEHTPVGTKMLEISQEGALWGTDTAQAHNAFKDDLPASPQAVSRVVTAGFSGDVIGEAFDGMEGGFSNEYEVVAGRDALQKANVAYQMSGQHDMGVVLHPKQARTADGDSESTPVDNGASSANGGVAYMQVFAVTGFTNFVGTVRDSSDDITYGDLVAFPDNVVAPYGARVTVAGTVERYLAFEWDVTGSGSITFWAGFARNP
jgi:hypothetical protein